MRWNEGNGRLGKSIEIKFDLRHTNANRHPVSVRDPKADRNVCFTLLKMKSTTRQHKRDTSPIESQQTHAHALHTCAQTLVQGHMDSEHSREQNMRQHIAQTILKCKRRKCNMCLFRVKRVQCDVKK